MNYNSIKTELSDDLISRNAVLKEISCWIGSGEYRYAMSERFLIDRLIDLPPVTPQEPKTNKENIHREREQAYMQGYEDACKKYRQEPKTGHRIYNDIYDHYLCGNCKTIVMDYDNFCPNCGADMRGTENE